MKIPPFLTQIKIFFISFNQTWFNKLVFRLYEAKKEDSKFGLPTTGITNIKNLIYYRANEEPDNVKELYYKSHGTTDPR